MDAHRTVGVDGRTIVPNSFLFHIAPSDEEQLADLLGTLRQLADAAHEHARDEQYGFVGPIEVQIEADDAFGAACSPSMHVSPKGTAACHPARCCCPRAIGCRWGSTSSRSAVPTTARSCWPIPTSAAANAEIRPSGDGFVVVDLGSANGTKVNDPRVAEHQLREGDEVRFGNTVMHFQAS